MAKNNKDVAMVIIVQAIIDEGAMGADGTINITYTSQENIRDDEEEKYNCS